MKLIERFANGRFAQPAALVMKVVCYFIIGFYILCTILSLMGRQTFFLHTKTGAFEQAIYAEESHDAHPSGMTVRTGDDIHVWTNENDQIDLTIQIGLSLLYAVQTVPMIFAYWFLSRVFSNTHKGRIFTRQNASYLLYFGLIQFSAAVFVPLLKLGICWLVNLVSDSRMSLSTGQDMLNMLIPGAAFMAAAYIIHEGVRLLNEADHTV
ncbi:MAG: hypothetical protein HFE43_03835 [Oscillospiraceae bacterium]|nr:hypothetical protein [Oscillospiraceae bacterium]